MSLIGPRLRPEFDELLSKDIPFTMVGINFTWTSGWAQINYHAASINDSKLN